MCLSCALNGLRCKQLQVLRERLRRIEIGVPAVRAINQSRLNRGFERRKAQGNLRLALLDETQTLAQDLTGALVPPTGDQPLNQMLAPEQY